MDGLPTMAKLNIGKANLCESQTVVDLGTETAGRTWMGRGQFLLPTPSRTCFATHQSSGESVQSVVPFSSGQWLGNTHCSELTPQEDGATPTTKDQHH